MLLVVQMIIPTVETAFIFLFMFVICLLYDADSRGASVHVR